MVNSASKNSVKASLSGQTATAGQRPVQADGGHLLCAMDDMRRPTVVELTARKPRRRMSGRGQTPTDTCLALLRRHPPQMAASPQTAPRPQVRSRRSDFMARSLSAARRKSGQAPKNRCIRHQAVIRDAQKWIPHLSNTHEPLTQSDSGASVRSEKKRPVGSLNLLRNLEVISSEICRADVNFRPLSASANLAKKPGIARLIVCRLGERFKWVRQNDGKRENASTTL